MNTNSSATGGGNSAAPASSPRWDVREAILVKKRQQQQELEKQEQEKQRIEVRFFVGCLRFGRLSVSLLLHFLDCFAFFSSSYLASVGQIPRGPSSSSAEATSTSPR